MPTYEYACPDCGNQWEQVQRITEDPVKDCPACGKSSAHRLISAGTNFILKGGGWYSDLYASPKAAPAKAEASGSADTSAKSESKTSEKSESKSESKSEAAADAKPATPAAAAPAAPSSST